MAATEGLPRATRLPTRRLSRRVSGRQRATIGASTLVVVALAGGGVSRAGDRLPPNVAPTQAIATLMRSHRVFSSPESRTSSRTIAARRPITGEQTVLPVVGRVTVRDGTRWLRVMLPGRPNGGRGWMTQRGTVLGATSWHVVVRTSSRRVLVYRHGRFERSFSAIVGKPSTPTPRGQFFVEESVALASDVPGGPFALALSARSDVLQEFDGGPGQIAIHGLANLGGTLGTAVSHGCIRLGLPSITWLVTRIAPGTPITIIR